MARLTRRRTHLAARTYLCDRAFWPAVEGEVAGELGRLRQSRDPSDRLVVIDLGCGQRPYADLFCGTHYVGLNLNAEDARPDVIGDATDCPFADGCADLVFCSQVIEHVQRPTNLMAEAYRVLRPGGSLVVTAPFYWPLHEEPDDYFRYTRHGMALLLEQAGFDAISVRSDSLTLTQVALSFVQLLPRAALPLVVLINLAVPTLQRFSTNSLCAINYLAVGRKR